MLVTIFWIALAVLLFFIGACAERDDSTPVGAFLTIVAVGLGILTAAMSNPTPADIGLFVSNIWVPVLATVLGYTVAGAAWATWKWFLRVNGEEIQSQLKLDYEEWKQKKDKGDLWQSDATFETSSYARIAQVGHNKARLVRWVVWWPGSVLWNCTYRLVHRIAIWVYDSLKSIWNRISSNAIYRVVDKPATNHIK